MFMVSYPLFAQFQDPTGAEVILAARNPGNKDQKTKEKTETKPRNKTPIQQ